MRPGPTDEILKRIELIEGRAADEALRIRYIEGMETTRALCKKWRLKNRTLMRLMAFYGVKARGPSEAVQLQWSGNTERRKISAEVMRKIAGRQSAEGRHPRKGKTKETDEGTRRAAEKLKTATSARRPDVRAKMAESRRTLHLEHPEIHPNFSAQPTRCEQLMLDALSLWGVRSVHSFMSPPYWLDIVLPDSNICIECFSKGRCHAMEWARHVELTQRGFHVMYVANPVIERGDIGDIREHIAMIQALGANPSAQRENSVVWGCQNLTLFRSHPDNVAVIRSRVGSVYRLDFSAPAENKITGL